MFVRGSIVFIFLLIGGCACKDIDIPSSLSNKKSTTKAENKKTPASISVVLTENEPVPNWTINKIKIDDSCSKMLDHCVLIRCDIKSNGGDQNDGTIIMSLKQGQDDIKKYQSIQLRKNGVQTIQYEFNEAEFFGSTPKGQCEVQYEGMKVTCELTNSGESSGDGTLYYKLIMKDGSDMIETESVEVSGNDSKTKTKILNANPYEVIRTECDFR